MISLHSVLKWIWKISGWLRCLDVPKPRRCFHFYPSEKGNFLAFFYWKLEKAMQGIWNRSVAAQSTALRTEIWRRPNNSDQHCQEKKQKNKKTRRKPGWSESTSCSNGQRGWTPTRQIWGCLGKEASLLGYGHIAKEGRLPKCPASPLLWEERLCQQKFGCDHTAGNTTDHVWAPTVPSSSPISSELYAPLCFPSGCSWMQTTGRGKHWLTR